jgi:hypothetical protein
MTLRELKRHLRRLELQCGRQAGKHRFDKYRDRSIGRQMAYRNVLELLEQLDPDEVRVKQHERTT